MRIRIERCILLLITVFFLVFFALVINYYNLAFNEKSIHTEETRSFITINAGDTEGTIYDRNLIPLTNRTDSVVAVVVPSSVKFEDVYSIASDKNDFCEKYETGRPFAFECTEKGEESPGITFFNVPIRYNDKGLASHVVGYLSDSKGASGIEYAYDRILRGEDTENSVTYSTDGFGNILIGTEKIVVRSSLYRSGVVTTLDYRIQKICEKAGHNIEKGAIVVTNVETGEIVALASFPNYSVEKIEEAICDDSCPLINRALYSYSVGSVFKLVTACEAIEEDLSGYVYDCTGNIDIEGQIFHCHKFDGHSVQTMSEAMTNSCNTYFIALNQLLDTDRFHDLASELGFGREIYLCAGMTGSAGVLPTLKELHIPAEKANFSFGQGRLTATPLQINALTCTIANGGEFPMLKIIRGITKDGESIINEKKPRMSRVFTEDTALKLRKMMIDSVYQNDNSNARPQYICVGAKTSTAQTGRYDEYGEELCNAWITGFFPSSSPTYAITVLVEDGGYGNDTAAPVFSQIVDEIMNI